AAASAHSQTEDSVSRLLGELSCVRPAAFSCSSSASGSIAMKRKMSASILRRRRSFSMRHSSLAFALLLLTSSISARATVFATVHGVVHDPQHRPIAGAQITLKAADSAFAIHTKTSNEGEFELPQAPIGVYTLSIAAPGFATVDQPLTVASGTNPVLHIPLPIAPASQTVVVSGSQSSLSADDTV